MKESNNESMLSWRQTKQRCPQLQLSCPDFGSAHRTLKSSKRLQRINSNMSFVPLKMADKVEFSAHMAMTFFKTSSWTDSQPGSFHCSFPNNVSYSISSPRQKWGVIRFFKQVLTGWDFQIDRLGAVILEMASSWKGLTVIEFVKKKIILFRWCMFSSLSPSFSPGCSSTASSYSSSYCLSGDFEEAENKMVLIIGIGVTILFDVSTSALQF